MRFPQHLLKCTARMSVPPLWGIGPASRFVSTADFQAEKVSDEAEVPKRSLSEASRAGFANAMTEREALCQPDPLPVPPPKEHPKDEVSCPSESRDERDSEENVCRVSLHEVEREVDGAETTHQRDDTEQPDSVQEAVGDEPVQRAEHDVEEEVAELTTRKSVLALATRCSVSPTAQSAVVPARVDTPKRTTLSDSPIARQWSQEKEVAGSGKRTSVIALPAAPPLRRSASGSQVEDRVAGAKSASAAAVIASPKSTPPLIEPKRETPTQSETRTREARTSSARSITTLDVAQEKTAVQTARSAEPDSTSPPSAQSARRASKFVFATQDEPHEAGAPSRDVESGDKKALTTSPQSNLPAPLLAPQALVHTEVSARAHDLSILFPQEPVRRRDDVRGPVPTLMSPAPLQTHNPDIDSHNSKRSRGDDVSMERPAVRRRDHSESFDRPQPDHILSAPPSLPYRDQPPSLPYYPQSRRGEESFDLPQSLISPPPSVMDAPPQQRRRYVPPPSAGHSSSDVPVGEDAVSDPALAPPNELPTYPIMDSTFVCSEPTVLPPRPRRHATYTAPSNNNHQPSARRNNKQPHPNTHRQHPPPPYQPKLFR